MASDFARLNTEITSADLEQAANDRVEDAAILEAAGRYGAAMAARLYALEMYVKFLTCRHLDLSRPIKRLEIHDLDALILFAGCSRALEEMAPGGNLRQNWDKLLDFSKKLNNLRYLPASRWTEQQSRDLFLWLNDPTDGVLTWLKTRT